MQTTPETNVPKTIKKEHIGKKVIYKIPHSVALSEGEITAISPKGKFFRIGEKRWMDNCGGQVLAMLGEGKPTKRAGAI